MFHKDFTKNLKFYKPLLIQLVIYISEIKILFLKITWTDNVKIKNYQISLLF